MERWMRHRREGNPWFVAMDIAKELGYSNERKATFEHCKKSIKINHNSET